MTVFISLTYPPLVMNISTSEKDELFVEITEEELELAKQGKLHASVKFYLGTQRFSVRKITLLRDGEEEGGDCCYVLDDLIQEWYEPL